MDTRTLYDVEVSISKTVYVLAENEDEAFDLARDNESEILLYVDGAEITVGSECETIKAIPARDHDEPPYSKGGTKDYHSLEQRFARERDVEEPTQAQIEAAGQQRLYFR